MGYMTLIAPCFACRIPFGSNPRKVPAYLGQPVCEACMTLINERRKAQGLPPFPIPADAYEPAEE